MRKKAFSIGGKSEIGGGGVKNDPKKSDIICGRPLITFTELFCANEKKRFVNNSLYIFFEKYTSIKTNQEFGTNKTLFYSILKMEWVGRS